MVNPRVGWETQYNPVNLQVHRWFDRSKRVATDLKESAGEKPPFGPSLKQARYALQKAPLATLWSLSG